jgi:hypothetical protein
MLPLERLSAGEGRTYVDTSAVFSMVLTNDPANRRQEFCLMRMWHE